MDKTINKLALFDTYERKVRIFEPIKNKTVGLYACGPTVYDYAHIGNLRTYIFTDILRRTLEFNNYNVNHVMNITYVGHLVSDADSGEDKMLKGARKHNKSAFEIAKYFEAAFLTDTDALNIKRAKTMCRATEHIEEQINYILEIEKKGFTYITADGVYFDTQELAKHNFKYGALAKLDIDGLQGGARVDTGEKRNLTDFALWKFSASPSKNNQSRQMQWDSPWGVGFPGWHIECSAMSDKYLGEVFDIHVGGEDHIPVHHSNEISQCQARHGKNPANFWMHGYFLKFNQEKISKSGKSLLLKSIIDKGIDPLAYRYLTLTCHYRSQLNFSWDALESANVALKRLKSAVNSYPDGGTIDTNFEIMFKNKINNDLNMPQAVTVLWAVIKSHLNDKDKKATVLHFDKILGMSLDQFSINECVVPEAVIALAKLRLQARLNKDWQSSDEFRKKIAQLGFLIEDSKGGYIITKK